LELCLQVAASGVLPYFSDYWHYLDALVVATSALDIIVAVLKLMAHLIGRTTFDFNVKGMKR
jgi:hypothetical protein